MRWASSLGGTVPGSLGFSPTQDFLQPPADSTDLVAVIQGVNHMSLYSDVDHLAKVGTVQSAWLHRLVSGAEAERYETAAE